MKNLGEHACEVFASVEQWDAMVTLVKCNEKTLNKLVCLKLAEWVRGGSEPIPWKYVGALFTAEVKIDETVPDETVPDETVVAVKCEYKGKEYDAEEFIREREVKHEKITI